MPERFDRGSRFVWRSSNGTQRLTACTTRRDCPPHRWCSHARRCARQAAAAPLDGPAGGVSMGSSEPGGSAVGHRAPCPLVSGGLQGVGPPPSSAITCSSEWQPHCRAGGRGCGRGCHVSASARMLSLRLQLSLGACWLRAAALLDTSPRLAAAVAAVAWQGSDRVCMSAHGQMRIR